jgi:hypothetical protein
MMVISFTYDETLKEAISNDGTKTAKAIMTIKFTEPASYIEITSDKTSDVLRFDYSFTGGDELVIYGDQQYATVNGSTIMPYLDLTSRFFDVAVGDNIYTIEPETAGYLVVEFQKRWR